MEIKIDGAVPEEPRARVLMIEAVAVSICKAAGTDPADAVTMLLTAAAHMTSKYVKPGVSARDQSLILAESLGGAIVASEEFFGVAGVTHGHA